MTQLAAIRSAEVVAALRAVAAGETSLAVRCEDRLAEHFLGLKHRMLTAIRPRPLLRHILHVAAPGSYGFAIARTRHFDETLASEIRAGVKQVVLLGAGYDSRPFRFQEQLAGVRIFEVDHPGTQARKRRILDGVIKASPANVSFIPVDFNRQCFRRALSEHGFARDAKTLFLWEGVSYYLPQRVVEGVLDFVAGCAPGSSILFDYAIKSFVDGDTSTYGGKQVARWLKRIGEPFLFGLDAAATGEFLAGRKLELVSDLGPEELETSYLRTTDGCCLGRTLGHVRMAHAAVPSR